ncbi:MAG: class I SAM-dependent methyltransferase [Planctomycetota bacterium]
MELEQTGGSAIPAIELRRPDGLEAIGNIDLIAELARRVEDAGLTRREIRLLELFHRRLGIALDTDKNRFSREFLSRRLDTYYGFHRAIKDNLAGETVLELGAGPENPLGTVFAMVLLGAARGIALEPSHLQSEARQASALLDTVHWLSVLPESFPRIAPVDRAEILRRAAQFPLRDYAHGRLTADPRLQLIQGVAEDVPVATGSVDRTMSVAFLEHVEDADACLAEMARVTRPGGGGVHLVDMADHGFYTKAVPSPITFLLERPDAAMVRHSNRLRGHEWDAAFERHGFEILSKNTFQRHAWTADELRSRVARFAEMTTEQLEPLGTTYVIRRR